jgi:hypothetical protein
MPKKWAIPSALDLKKLRYLNNPRKPRLKPIPMYKTTFRIDGFEAQIRLPNIKLMMLLVIKSPKASREMLT